jgi:hypothetical protein
VNALLKLPFYYGWIVLSMLMLAGAVAAGSTQPFMAVMLRPMTEEFGWSRTEATTAISLGTIGAGPSLAPSSGGWRTSGVHAFLSRPVVCSYRWRSS